MLFYFDYLVAAEAADAERTETRSGSLARSQNIKTRRENDPFTKLNERQFIKRFRLSKVLVKELVEDIKPHLQTSKRSDGIDAQTKVLVALNFYATGSYQTSVADNKHIALSQASISKSINEVTNVLNLPDLFKKYIHFPVTRQERENVKRRFYQDFRMPGVLGCVDGTHVSIIRPVEHEERFYNRKGYHSLNVMIICDSRLQILCVDPSYPGSTHDRTVWQHHPLNRYLSRLGPMSGEFLYLLGDSGYPLRRTLLTPILNAATGTPENYYTQQHIHTRTVVERCIGVLKGRVRCLLAARQLHYDPVTAAKIVNACCILHNIAHGARLHFIPLTEAEQEEEARLTSGASFNKGSRLDAGTELQEGQAVRDQLVQSLWQARTRLADMNNH